MSLTQQTMQRLPTIKAELIKGTSYPDIGKQLGVTERTIDRDVKAFVNSGDFETWLKEEWLRLHNQVIHNDPIEAYRNVSKLISRMVTQKQEIKETHISIDGQITELIHISRVEECKSNE
jgi:K+/H+ antiporter YhaU regulatory subunit KhtT